MKRFSALLAAEVLGCLLMAQAGASAYDVELTIPVPKGTEVSAEQVKLAGLPAGKRLAVILYVDWSYRLAKDALPLAEAFKADGWRATFFLAGAKDISKYAPELEALGHEVATNLLSGGISAYRDEMFSYSPQDILNAIGPLKSELNAVLRRPVVTQLVRGHSVPYRDRIRAMDYVWATHWYTHFAFFGRQSRVEARLRPGRGKGVIPIVRVAKLDESAIEQAEQNKARAVIFGRSGSSFSGDYKRFLKTHGGKKDYWYARLGEFASTIYVRRMAKVSAARVEGDKAHVTLALDEHFNPLFLRAPISLDLNGTVVDVPPETLLDGALEAKLALDPPRIRLPGETKLTVALTNRGKKGISLERVLIHPEPGFDVTVGPGRAGRLGPGESVEKVFTIRSNGQAGTHSFGFAPFPLCVRYRDGASSRTLLAARELEVRPALGVDVYPYDGVPLAPKASQTFMLTVDNIRAGRGRGNWKSLRGTFRKFILPPEGPVGGTIRFRPGEAFKVAPRRIDLALPAAGGRKVFYVTVTNTASAKEPYLLWPEIRLAGAEQPLLLPYGGTAVYRVEKLGSPALDGKGLLMYASWDNDKLDLPHADRARGRREAYRGAMGHVAYGPGVLGRCALHNTTCLLDPWLNFNEAEGTMMFWLRNDPGQKKLLRRRMSERILSVPTQHPAGNVDTCQLSLYLHAGGFLAARMMTIGPTYHQVRAPFKKTDEWQHVALTWSCPERSMRIIVNGEVRGELKDDGKSWYAVPARRWPEGYGDFMIPLSDDHGTYTSTMRDEFYIYNRPLSAEEIRQHIKRVNAKRRQAN